MKHLFFITLNKKSNIQYLKFETNIIKKNNKNLEFRYYHLNFKMLNDQIKINLYLYIIITLK